MKKLVTLIVLPFILLGCEATDDSEPTGVAPDDDVDSPSGTTTDVAYDSEQPILNADEVDWLAIDVPNDTIYTTETSFMYRLTLEQEDVRKLADPIIEQREGNEWIDVTPEEGNPNFSYHEMESMADVGMSVSLVGFGQQDEAVEHEVGEYRAIEVFFHGDGKEQEIVQVAIPFEVVEEVIPDQISQPDFVEVEPGELTVPPETESVTFTVTNHHEEHELFGGEYYRLEFRDGETWEEITPVEAFIDIGYSLEPGGSHEFTHQTLAEDDHTLEEGRYRIRKEFYLVTGTENIISDDAEQVEIAFEFEVRNE